MKIVPSFLFPRKTVGGLRDVNQGEQQIFELLKEINISSYDVALHSLNLTNHHRDRKRWHEIDFLIISCKGIFALEVKGGSVSCSEGVWRYSGKTTNLSPAAQAKNNYFTALATYIEPKFSRKIADVPSGFGCIFTQQSRFLTAMESALCEQGDEITAYEDETASPKMLKNFLNRLVRHWKTKKRKADQLDSETVDDIVQFLRPNFEKAPSLNSSLKMVYSELQELTDHQYRSLNLIHGVPRYIVTGGAGTGKSFLAMYAARKHAAEGKRVAFITRNPNFAAFVERQLAGSRAQVATLGALTGELGSSGPFDVLVLDEAQDLCSFEALTIIDDAIAGGIPNGNWNWFGDPNNQVSASVPFDLDAYRYWQDAASLVAPALEENIRNAPDVIELVANLTYANIGSRRNIGQRGEWLIEEAKDEIGAARLARDKLKSWAQENIEAREIALLVPSTEQCSNAKSIAKSAGFDVAVLEELGGDQQFQNSVIVAPVEVFKGLERPFVILYAFWCIENEAPYGELKSALYKSVTRANLSVYIVCTDQLSRAIGQLISEAFDRKERE